MCTKALRWCTPMQTLISSWEANLLRPIKACFPEISVFFELFAIGRLHTYGMQQTAGARRNAEPLVCADGWTFLFFFSDRFKSSDSNSWSVEKPIPLTLLRSAVHVLTYRHMIT